MGIAEMWPAGSNGKSKEREPLLPKAAYKMTDVSADSRGKQRSAGSASASDGEGKRDYGTHYDALYQVCFPR
eukprot:6883626-Pyramimonas_sp.AAC.1